MNVGRSQNSLVLQFPPADRGRGALSAAGAVLLLAAMFALGIGMFWPHYVDRFAACTSAKQCPMSEEEMGGPIELPLNREQFVAAAPCQLLEGSVRRASKPIFAEDVAHVMRYQGTCEPTWHLSPAQTQWALAGYDKEVDKLRQQRWSERVSLVQQAELLDLQQQLNRMRWLVPVPVALLALAGFLMVLGMARRRPIKVEFLRSRILVGRKSVHLRFLRDLRIDRGALVFEDIEESIQTRIPADTKTIETLLPALRAHLLGDLLELDLDALDAALAPLLPAGTRRSGELTVAWTQTGARIQMEPEHHQLWVRAQALAVLGLVGVGGQAVWSASHVTSETIGLVTAEECAAGHRSCGQARPEALRSIDGFAARRICALVDAPIRDASYDDATRLGAIARQEAAAGFAQDPTLEGLDTTPCRPEGWSLGEPHRPLKALWASGPRNTVVADTQINELVREAEAQITAEWPAYRPPGTIEAWEAGISAARQRMLGQVGLTGAFGALLLLGVVTSRRRLRGLVLEVEGKRILLDGRPFSLEAIASFTLEGNRVRLVLHDGENVLSPPLHQAGELGPFLEWIEARQTGVVEPPEEVRRLQRLTGARRPDKG